MSVFSPVGVEDPVRCPRCGSSQVHADQRGFSAVSGFFGQGKIVLTCLKCAEIWRPGDDLPLMRREPSAFQRFVIALGVLIGVFMAWEVFAHVRLF